MIHRIKQTCGLYKRPLFLIVQFWGDKTPHFSALIKQRENLASSCRLCLDRDENNEHLRRETENNALLFGTYVKNKTIFF